MNGSNLFGYAQCTDRGGGRAFCTFHTGRSFSGYTHERLETILRGSSLALRWNPLAAAGASSMFQLKSYELSYRWYPGSRNLEWRSLPTVDAHSALLGKVSNDQIDPGDARVCTTRNL